MLLHEFCEYGVRGMADVGCDEMGCGGWAGEQEKTVCQLRHAQAHNMPFTYMTCNTGIQHNLNTSASYIIITKSINHTTIQ